LVVTDNCSMTEQKHNNLRIFCLCGQKMQVTPEMYGRPAKCVACHQKWFIPEKEEIPDSAPVLHLKEHPELLRKPGQLVRFHAERPSVSDDTSGSQKQPTPPPLAVGETDDSEREPVGAELAMPKYHELAAEEATGATENEEEEPSPQCKPAVVRRNSSKIPLDAFEPMRLLYGYHEELQKRRKALAAASDGETHIASLEKYEQALQRVKDRLHRALELEQRSTAKQLTVIEDEIARLNIALRVGDCAIDSFFSQTNDLRRSREALERHNHNLLAWREVNDPYMAGGVADVALESFDEDAFDVKIPTPLLADAEKPLFVSYGDELRDMLRMRSALERRKAEWARIGEEQGFPESAVNEGLAETEAALARNMARMRFCLARMEQLVVDCDNDLKALGAYKSDVVERADKGQMRDSARRETLEKIQRLEEDVIRMRALVRQALTANSPVEVPEATDTLVKRLRGTVGKNMLAVDTLLFAMAAVLFIAGLLMFAETTTQGTDWLAALSSCAVIAIAAASVVLEKDMRSLIIALLWVALLVLVAVFLYRRSALDDYLVMLSERDGARILKFNLRGWLLVGGAVFVGVGTGIACRNYLRGHFSQELSGAGIILFCAVFSAATVAAAHTVAPRTVALKIEDGETQEMENGTGGRRNTVDSGETARADGANANAARTHASNASSPRNEANPAGAGDMHEDTEEFTGEAESADISATMIFFVMHGVVHGEGTEPRFRATLSFPDGRTESMALRLGDIIHDEWKAREYNQYTKKLTISNGERLLVLKAGESVPLPPNGVEPS